MAKFCPCSYWMPPKVVWYLWHFFSFDSEPLWICWLDYGLFYFSCTCENDCLQTWQFTLQNTWKTCMNMANCWHYQANCFWVKKVQKQKMFLKFIKKLANSFLNVSLNCILHRGYITHEHIRPSKSAKSKSINFPHFAMRYPVPGLYYVLFLLFSLRLHFQFIARDQNHSANFSWDHQLCWHNQACRGQGWTLGPFWTGP